MKTEKQKACNREYMKRYRADGRHRPVNHRQALRPEFKQRRRFQRTNWSADQYQQIFEEQQGCCAICGIHQSQLTKALCGDHNHETGETRALLCSTCNAGLGWPRFFSDDSMLLKKAEEYLRKWNNANQME